MKNGPSLVIRGTILGSIVLGLLGWFLAGKLELSPRAEVAYAAAPSQTTDEIVAQDRCQVNAS